MLSKAKNVVAACVRMHVGARVGGGACGQAAGHACECTGVRAYVCA